MRTLEIARLCAETSPALEPEQAHLFRGCLASAFSEFEILHNHDHETGKVKYRYPAVQFKVVGGKGILVAVREEAVKTLLRVFCEFPRRMRIGRDSIRIDRRTVEVAEEPMGETDKPVHYEFLTPWIALKSENAEKYRESDREGREDLLRRCLIGNLLSFSSEMDYRVEGDLEAEIRLEETRAVVKGMDMAGFVGSFAVNFRIPDFLGIGRTVSRGYGCVVAGGQRR